MKKLLILAAAFTLGTGVFAQDTTMNKKKMGKMHDKGMMMDHKMKDCVMMKDGEMMVMKGGETMKMDQDMTMSNGATVMQDGKVRMKDGKEMTMKDGDMMSMDGMMMKKKPMKKKM